MNKQDSVAVRYIGRREQWIERSYTRGITFDKGQVRMLPPEIARKLLRHGDLFEQAEAKSAPKAKAKPKDDTQQHLDKMREDKEEESKARQHVQDQHDAIMSMDKDALELYAYSNYQQSLDKRKSVETLREQVAGFVDQYGAV